MEKEIKESKFVSVGRGKDKFILGVVYKYKVPYNIVMGLKSEENKNNCIDKKYLTIDGKMWEFTSRKASDGDIL